MGLALLSYHSVAQCCSLGHFRAIYEKNKLLDLESHGDSSLPKLAPKPDPVLLKTPRSKTGTRSDSFSVINRLTYSSIPPTEEGPSAKRLVYKQLFEAFESLLSLVFNLVFVTPNCYLAQIKCGWVGKLNTSVIIPLFNM